MQMRKKITMASRTKHFPKLTADKVTSEKIAEIADRAIERNKIVFDMLARI